MQALAQYAMRLGLVLAVLGCLGCSSPIARIDVQLAALPTDAVSLEVTLLRTSSDASGQERALSVGVPRVIVLLTQPAPHGVRVHLRALRADGCLVAGGEREIAGPVIGEYSISVELQSPAEPSCQLDVKFSGLGSGSVQVQVETQLGTDTAPQSFLQSFSLRYPKGTRVTLQQYPELQPSDDSRFLGWAGACQGLGICQLTIGDERLVVEPSFTPRQLCTPDVRHSFCWENPLPQGNKLTDVWAASADHVWAVGGYGTVLRWNGTFWLPLRSPTTSSLSSVWGNGRGQVWVSGGSGLVQRFSEGEWHAEETATTAQLSRIRGVQHGSGSGLWAVGAGGLVLRRSDAGWRTVASPVMADLNGLYVRSENDVWMVGAAGVALHWDGESLQCSQTGVSVPLLDVWGSAADDVWAVGGNSTLLHWNGVGWTQFVLENQHGTLQAIWGTGARDIWIAAGSRDFWHYDGSSWQRVSAGISARLRAFSAIHGSDPNNVWFVGTAGQIRHWNGVYLSNSVGSSYQDDLNNIWFDGQNQLIVSGDSGTGYQRSGDQWFLFVQPTTRSFFKIAPLNDSGPQRVGVTVGGELGIGTGADWIFYNLGTKPKEALVDVFVAGQREFWVVGSAGTIVRCPDLVCTQVDSGVTTPLVGVWGSSKSDIWIVGAGGVILHWDGGALTSWPSPTSSGLWSVWGRSSREAWAVGFNGTVLQWDGTQWRSIGPTGLPVPLGRFTGVWASGPSDVWVSSDSGRMYHFDGTLWERIETGYDGLLNRVTGAASGEIWAVGADGAILKRRTAAR